MNISISQVIWTIICFALFALVLDRLLIRPVLDNIDRRREKIDRAHGRKDELEAARRAAEEAAHADSLARREKLAKEHEKAIAEATERSERELEELSAELKAREESALSDVAAHSAETEAKLDAAMGGMIDAFTELLTTGGDL